MIEDSARNKSFTEGGGCHSNGTQHGEREIVEDKIRYDKIRHDTTKHSKVKIAEYDQMIVLEYSAGKNKIKHYII